MTMNANEIEITITRPNGMRLHVATSMTMAGEDGVRVQATEADGDGTFASGLVLEGRGDYAVIDECEAEDSAFSDGYVELGAVIASLFVDQSAYTNADVVELERMYEDVQRMQRR